MTAPPEPLTLDVPGLRIAALAWGPVHGAPVLAFHGWLDNAATWTGVAPSLAAAGMRVVAIDFPGHGASSHRSSDATYSFGDMLLVALDVLDALGWGQASLLGHSMGGAVAMMTAAAAPERVVKAALVEGFTPLTTPEEDAGAQLRRGLASTLRYRNGENRPHLDRASIEARIAARPWPILPSSVATLADRGTRRDGDAWVFTHDPRLKSESLSRLTRGQVGSIVACVTCPVLLVAARDSLPYANDEIQGYFARLPQLQFVAIDGHHHVHMDHPERVAPHVLNFLA